MKLAKQKIIIIIFILVSRSLNKHFSRKLKYRIYCAATPHYFYYYLHYLHTGKAFKTQQGVHLLTYCCEIRKEPSQMDLYIFTPYRRRFFCRTVTRSSSYCDPILCPIKPASWVNTVCTAVVRLFVCVCVPDEAEMPNVTDVLLNVGQMKSDGD